MTKNHNIDFYLSNQISTSFRPELEILLEFHSLKGSKSLIKNLNSHQKQVPLHPNDTLNYIEI